MTLRDSHSSFCSELIWLFRVFYSFFWISGLFPLFLVKNFVRMYWVCKLALATLSFHNINLNNLWTWKCFLFLCLTQFLFVFYSLDLGSYLLFWLSLIGIWFWRALWVGLLYQFLSKLIVMHRKTTVFACLSQWFSLWHFDIKLCVTQGSFPSGQLGTQKRNLYGLLRGRHCPHFAEILIYTSIGSCFSA